MNIHKELLEHGYALVEDVFDDLMTLANESCSDHLIEFVKTCKDSELNLEDGSIILTTNYVKTLIDDNDGEVSYVFVSVDDKNDQSEIELLNEEVGGNHPAFIIDNKDLLTFLSFAEVVYWKIV